MKRTFLFFFFFFFLVNIYIYINSIARHANIGKMSVEIFEYWISLVNSLNIYSIKVIVVNCMSGCVRKYKFAIYCKNIISHTLLLLYSICDLIDTQSSQGLRASEPWIYIYMQSNNSNNYNKQLLYFKRIVVYYVCHRKLAVVHVSTVIKVLKLLLVSVKSIMSMINYCCDSCIFTEEGHRLSETQIYKYF